ncbi:MAG: NYN domain-containing protein, partial [Patescibacteria group bacterium]
KRVFAFIDSQNLNLGVKSQGWELDFARFRILLKDKYNVERAYLFIGYIPINKNLYIYLQKSGYTIIYKPTVELNSNTKPIKGNVDAELVLHAMIEFSKYQKAIIVSGDGDFYCLVEYLRKKRKLDKIIVPSIKYSSLLREFAPYIVNIASFKDRVKNTK